MSGCTGRSAACLPRLGVWPPCLSHRTWLALVGPLGLQPAYVTGLQILGLPIEEYLFFVVAPLCAILAFEAVCATLADVSSWLSARRERLVGRLRR